MGEVIGTEADDAPRVIFWSELRVRVAADMLIASVTLVVDRPSLFILDPSHSHLY
jgi:hypothetical protein